MIKANFSTYASYATDSLYQWDLNQVLSVSGLNLNVIPEVHFSNAHMENAIVRQATMKNHIVSVQIPNSLLQDPLTIHAHIGIYEGATFKVVEHVEIPVIPRKRPSDYRIEDSDEEIYSFEALKNALANKADSTVINARVDSIITHNNDTEGNTELIDMRVDANGKTHTSAGAAMRDQFVNLHSALTNEVHYLRNPIEEISPVLYNGFVRYTNGTHSDDTMGGFYKRTDYIPIPLACEKIVHNFRVSANGVDGYALFDGGYNFISGGRTTVITNIPTDARYIMFTNYDDTFKHADKTIVIRAERVTDKKVNIEKLVTFGDSHVARNVWQGAVLDHFNIENHVNLGVGSSSVAVNEKATQLPFVDNSRIDSIKTADPDTIIIIGGTNDVHLDTPVGGSSELSKAIDSKNKSNFYGAYSYLLETLLNWKPTARIILCTPPQGYYDISHTVKYSEVAKAVREIAGYYSLPVADIFSECGINKINLSTYSDDLIHYNELGNSRVSAVIISTIENSYLAH